MIYLLQIDIMKVVKGDKAFHVYLNNLKSTWDELQLHIPLSTSLETLKKRKEEDRIFKLPAGLDLKILDALC